MSPMMCRSLQYPLFKLLCDGYDCWLLCGVTVRCSLLVTRCYYRSRCYVYVAQEVA